MIWFRVVVREFLPFAEKCHHGDDDDEELFNTFYLIFSRSKMFKMIVSEHYNFRITG